MIDPEQVKQLTDSVHALLPPSDVLGSFCGPVVQRDSPVLSPFLDEVVVLEDLVRWSSSAPTRLEQGRLRPDIGAVIRYAKRHIAHEVYAQATGVRLDLAPLREGHPLPIGEEAP